MAEPSPKVKELMESPHAVTVNEMLDAGRSPNDICRYLKSEGFEISVPSMYKYADVRREALLQAVTNPDVTDIEVVSPEEKSARKRLLTELQALDDLIEKGYEAIQRMEPEDVTPKMFMDAIRLKHELTGGTHAGLTEYGYNSIKQIEDKKWKAVIQFMLVYVPEDRQAEVMQGVEQIEKDIYEGTPWYGEYQKAKALAEGNPVNT